MKNISLVIPSYNNLRHLKNAYESVRKFYKKTELILIDDGSTDNTKTWLDELEDDFVIKYRSEERVGHTILYDKGIDMATNEIVGIMHADMILGPNYLENVLKHLERGKVVCATRIEPPLHPEGKEKIIRNFGMDFDDLNIETFEEFVIKSQDDYKDQTTRGMFAPWVLYKEDFQDIGGHDHGFAPFPYEDSDIFQRWILAGYELIQSRDAFVYHLTCRGHRWTEQIGKDDDYFKQATKKAAKHYIRKWGSWVKNDEYQYPTIIPKYDIGLVVKTCNSNLLELLEPWCSNIYIEDDMQVLTVDYFEKEKNNTLYDLSERIKPYDNEKNNEILVRVDAASFNQDDFKIIQQLPEIIKDNGQVGSFQLGNLFIDIIQMNEYQNTLIKN